MKKRIPRKLKKATKGAILTYDICGLPKWNKIEEIITMFKEKRVVFWASKASENMSQRDLDVPPTVVNCKYKYHIKDLSKNGK